MFNVTDDIELINETMSMLPTLVVVIYKVSHKKTLKVHYPIWQR